MKEINQTFLDLRRTIISRDSEIEKLKKKYEEEIRMKVEEINRLQMTLQNETSRKDQFMEYMDRAAEKHAHDIEMKVLINYIK